MIRKTELSNGNALRISVDKNVTRCNRYLYSASISLRTEQKFTGRLKTFRSFETFGGSGQPDRETSHLFESGIMQSVLELLEAYDDDLENEVLTFIGDTIQEACLPSIAELERIGRPKAA